jgi:hypothetical protein
MSILISIVKLLPLIIQLVQSLEQVIPASGTGKTKLAIAQQVMDAAYGESQDLQKDMPKEQWIQVITSLIGKIVSVFNANGLFKKASA